MDQESQERFRRIEEMILKFAAQDLILAQRLEAVERKSEDDRILLDQLLQSQLRLEAMTEELKVSNAELKAGNEESRRREFRLEDIVVDHQKVLRLHEGRIGQIERAA